MLFAFRSGDDKLALFRQQAAIIARKKEGTATRLKAVTDELSAAQEELNAKRETARGAAGQKVRVGFSAVLRAQWLM